jgi:chromosome segregation ATPase
MKIVLGVIIAALLLGAAWFYVNEYQPLIVAVATLTNQNDSLTSAKAKIASLNAQITALNSQVNELINENNTYSNKVSQLVSQANSQRNSSSANAVVDSQKEFVPPDPIPAQPNWNWTVDGKDYHNVVITQVEADIVHITYDGGLGTVNTSDLTPDIQKMLNYDPQLAKVTSQQRAAAQAQTDSYIQQALTAQSLRNAAQKASSLRVEQQKLAQRKAQMDKAYNALTYATTHVNRFGVLEGNSSAHDKDGGAERAASVTVLQSNYDSASDAYNAELRVVTDLQN